MKRLKSFVKKAPRSKGPVSTASPPHPETRLGPAQLLDDRSKHERADQPRDQHSHARPSAPSSHESSKHTSSGPSVQSPSSGIGGQSIGATDYAPQPRGAPEDDTIANDYRAYISAMSPGSVGSTKGSTNAEYVSLGSDSRLRTGDSEMKHSEDIADRNIEHSGSYSSPSRKGSQESETAGNQTAVNPNDRKKSFTASTSGSSSSYGSKYSAGAGVASPGSLIDGILPHVEDSHAQPLDRKMWPTRLARDETNLPSSRLGRRGTSSVDPSRLKCDSFGRRNEKMRLEKGDTMDLREILSGDPGDYGLKAALDGVVDLRDTEDADKETRWAPAVTHEVVKPHDHEIVEERIYREIHNHEVYHYIQPVYETEILPARHWVYNVNNELVEVSADELPECTGAKQRWAIVRGDKENPSSHIVRSAPQAREPRILSDKTYITPEGFERRETTILHPPKLEDLSDYSGPVVPIEFLHHPEHAPERELRAEQRLDHLPNDRKFTMDELADALPVARTGSSSSSSAQPTDSSASSPMSKQLSIPRKPVPTVS